MCGIAGAIGPIDADVLDTVRAIDASQVHRGPDDAGAWHTDPNGAAGCALAHRRLAIVDLDPGAAQPMVDPETGAVIVFNGEIFNFRELRESFVAGGAAFTTRGDTEVILHAYRRWGTACVEHLRGQFAFVLWDPAKRRVLVARDRLGIKPLYWTIVSRGGAEVLLFASELRSLLAGGVPRRLDPVGLATYLWNGFVVGPGTIVKNVNLFPAGSTAVVDPDDPRIDPRRYWLPPEDAAGTRHPDELRAALREAVRLRLVSDVPLGVFLSGGIDSSAVAAIAAGASDTPIRTFTVGFDEAAYDESGPAKAVAEALGTEHELVRLSSGMFGDFLPSALAGLDQPTFDAVNTSIVSRAVREAGLTVALAGTGGDELFGGYRSFVDVPRAVRAARLLRGVPPRLVHAGAGAVARRRMGPFGVVPPQTRWGKLGDALVTGGDLVGAYQAAYGLYARDFLAELLEDGTDHATVHGLSSGAAEALGRLVRGAGPLHAVSLLELSNFVGQRLLRDTDAASMAVSLEVRVPLLDHEVVEVAAGLDSADRFEPLGSKSMLRRVALDGLDPGIFDRPKQGFELPFDAWCRGPLRPSMEELFDDAAACAAIGINGAAVRRLWAAFLGHAPGIYWSRVWALYVLLWWCREHGVER